MPSGMEIAFAAGLWVTICTLMIMFAKRITPQMIIAVISKILLVSWSLYRDGVAGVITELRHSPPEIESFDDFVTAATRDDFFHGMEEHPAVNQHWITYLEHQTIRPLGEYPSHCDRCEREHTAGVEKVLREIETAYAAEQIRIKQQNCPHSRKCVDIDTMSSGHVVRLICDECDSFVYPQARTTTDPWSQHDHV